MWCLTPRPDLLAAIVRVEFQVPDPLEQGRAGVLRNSGRRGRYQGLALVADEGLPCLLRLEWVPDPSS